MRPNGPRLISILQARRRLVLQNLPCTVTEKSRVKEFTVPQTDQIVCPKETTPTTVPPLITTTQKKNTLLLTP